MIVPVSASLAAIQFAGGNVSSVIFMYGAIVAIFYFVLIRPQQKARKVHEGVIQTLKRGDMIVTAGGIVGEVVNIVQAMKDGAAAPTMNDLITIKSGESRLVVERGKIARVANVSAPTA